MLNLVAKLLNKYKTKCFYFQLIYQRNLLGHGGVVVVIGATKKHFKLN